MVRPHTHNTKGKVYPAMPHYCNGKWVEANQAHVHECSICHEARCPNCPQVWG